MAIEGANVLEICWFDDYRASQGSYLKEAILVGPTQGHDPRVTHICPSGDTIAMEQAIPRPPKRPKPHVTVARHSDITPERLKLVCGVSLAGSGWQMPPPGDLVDKDVQEPVQLAQAVTDNP
ncbi:hypothetical protein [Sphingomonas sp. MS122]|uniref:hypothetical protein n=1 Tax=Sphingomonas sp. MS122 TaxID=3412683 RepID=UPI003C2FC2C1